MDYSRLSMPLGEAIFTQRSIRRFKPDPIPLADLRLIIEAAVKAPNGGNQQVARFLVVSDPTTIREFGPLYREAWWAKRRDEGFQGPEDLPARYQPAAGLADAMSDVPCVIFALALARRSCQLRHPRRPEPHAGGTRPRHRLRADNAPPVRHGPLPRDVRHPRRCRLSSLRAARLSRRATSARPFASRRRRRPSSIGGTLRFPGRDRRRRRQCPNPSTPRRSRSSRAGTGAPCRRRGVPVHGCHARRTRR